MISVGRAEDIKKFEGQTAIVTGGGTGMGRAAALRLGREGANVVIAGRRTKELQEVYEEIVSQGGSALAVQTDVADPRQVEALVNKTLDVFGSLDIAWNNAGILGAFSPLHQLSFEDFDTLMSVNLRGVFACLKYEIAAMLDLGIRGSIVNTSSWTAHGAMPGTSGYAASKGALDAMMRTVALEVGPSNIRVNNVSPGMIATPMSQEVLSDEATARPFIKQTPLQRVGQSEDVADVVVWLLSDDARFVTGQSILVDGGYTIGGLRP
ncbi:SDR family NAD(P)-dependent oxidoreductase [Paenibacillus zeisoli]|uniref:SDR family NAD(P)-dependent oxidoreductase n=1 Tax=Paenibacillus zeisoli TaxID=2496267 RepID=UPI00163BB911|nr:SDR family oxidoreductase [Paenibacillus zeisoli]